VVSINILIEKHPVVNDFLRNICEITELFLLTKMFWTHAAFCLSSLQGFCPPPGKEVLSAIIHKS
jgi:hypothetical protein